MRNAQRTGKDVAVSGELIDLIARLRVLAANNPAAVAMVRECLAALSAQGETAPAPPNPRLAIAALRDETLSDGAARAAALLVLDPEPVTPEDIAWARQELGETAPKEAAMSRVWCNQCRAVHAVGLHAGETAPAPVDEQELCICGHARIAHRLYERYCHIARCSCEHWRPVSQAAASPLPSGEGLEQLARECGEDVVRYIGVALQSNDSAAQMRERTEAIILAALTRARAQEPQP